MELAALSPRSSTSSTPSSCNSHDSRCSRHCRHRHRHGPRHATEDAADRERDDAYRRHRKNRRRSFERRQQQEQEEEEEQRQEHRRRHTNSSNSMSCSSHRNSDELSLASTCDDRPGLNLPLDKQFLPLDSPTQDEEDEKDQQHVRDQVICMIFDLPESTQFYQDFSCAIASTLAMHGRMYPTSSHVCFYSNVFGRERKILIPYESIRELEKTTTMVFQHSIRLATFDKDEYTFTSFWGNNRDSCYDLILKTRDRVLRELRPTSVNSTETRYPALPTSPVSSNSGASPPASSAANPAAEQSDEEVAEEDEDAAASDHDEAAPVANEDTDATTEAADGEDQTAPATPRRRSVVSDIDSIAPKDISMTQILEEVFPVSVDTFMQTFFLDDAPFGLDKFGEQTGSTEMTMNPWMTPLEDDKNFGMTRSLQFRVPIDAPIGPKSSQVDVLQCLKEKEHGVRVVESSTRLVDIPYGDYFSVEERWTIVPISSNPNACKIFIELKVVFGKSTFWKNTIETRSISDNRAKWEKWVGMAKEYLASRELDEAAHCAPESPPTSSTSSEKAVLQEAIRKDRGSMGRRRSRSKMTLSSIERSLSVNTELIGDLQRQLVSIQAGACPVTT